MSFTIEECIEASELALSTIFDSDPATVDPAIVDNIAHTANAFANLAVAKTLYAEYKENNPDA